VRKPPSRRSTRHMLNGPFRSLSISHVQLERGSRRTKASAQCCAVPHHHSHRRAGRSASPECRSCATTAEGGDPSSCALLEGGQTGPVRRRSCATTALVNNPSVLCGRTSPHSTLLLYVAGERKARGSVGLRMGVHRGRDDGLESYLRGQHSLNHPTQKPRRRAASSPLQVDAIIASSFSLSLQWRDLKIARKLPEKSSKSSSLLPDGSRMMGKG
jgi:hypothetical protein